MSSKGKPSKLMINIPLKNGETVELSEKQYRFAQIWFETQDKDKARKEVGWTPGYLKSKWAKIRDNIDPLIVMWTEEVNAKTMINKQRVLEELGHTAFANPLDYIHEDGTPKELTELTREQASAIDQFEVTKGKGGKVTTSYKFCDKTKSREMIGRHLGMFDYRILMHARHEHEHRHKIGRLDLSKIGTDELRELHDHLRRLEGSQYEEGEIIESSTEP